MSRPIPMLAVASLAIGCYGDLNAPPEDNGREELTIALEGEELHCLESTYERPEPPLHLLETEDIDCDESDRFCFRMKPEFRAVVRDPGAALARSAEHFDLYLRSGDETDRERANAFADLAVSGRESHALFAALRPSDVDARVDAEAIDLALERAYEVAWALRGPPEHRASARAELGWIAISPEDDLPDRPVDVWSAPYPQVDFDVVVPMADGSTRTVRTRAVIASTIEREAPSVPQDLTFAIPPIDTMAIPDRGELVLLIHGHSSRAEEGALLIPALLREYADRGEDATIVAMDLPSNAYAERIDPEEIYATDPNDDALLRFQDAFIVAFGDAIGGRIDAVIGGSLGGNLVMRLAEQMGNRAWPRRVVAWSPASIDWSWSHARWFAGDGEFVDGVKAEAVRMTFDASRAIEDETSREDFFTGGLLSVKKQAEYWYRPEFAPCGERLVAQGLAQLGESYDARFRAWHYRVVYEQLVFSHLERDANGVRPFERIAIPFLLVTGDGDDSSPVSTYSFVERLAPYLTSEGRTLFLENTGHAMHSERPNALAAQIASFLEGE